MDQPNSRRTPLNTALLSAHREKEFNRLSLPQSGLRWLSVTGINPQQLLCWWNNGVGQSALYPASLGFNSNHSMPAKHQITMAW